jgi:hypothetical protein
MDKTFYQRHTPGRHGLLEHFPDRAGLRNILEFEFLKSLAPNLIVGGNPERGKSWVKEEGEKVDLRPPAPWY